ncbi:MAG: PDDEXK nuclease domain-containing protein [Candidatus Omnitrophota bacterium]|nr:PDDEXK nuclease domain-containing protein [Candidatus Omnitrophota bacterium]
MKHGLNAMNYKNLLLEVKERIHRAQYEALKAVNKELIALYWDIGKIVVEKQKKHGWGKSIVENLARDLQLEFPGIHGFSVQNIWYMRQFYLEYHRNAKLQPLVGEISWTKHLVIMSRCKDMLEREFYIRMTRKFGWTKNILIHQINTKAYERTLLNQTNFDKALPDRLRHQAKLAVKDEYTFDFLELEEDHNELELEREVMKKMNRFLVEMGGVFAFMGNQFRIEIEGNEFFVDILLYHRHLKCLVAIELKIGKFIPEYAGKMQFYLSVLDDLVKTPDENPSIGIILCRDKNRTIVEYALKDSGKPIGIGTYTLMTRLPKDLKRELPSPEQIAKLLEEAK